MGDSSSDATLALKTKPDDVPKWFWDGTKGNDLIKKLNDYAERQHLSDRIRREKHCPHIYAIVLNNFLIAGDGRWKLVKVGFTHQPVKRGRKNRMELLKRKIEKELKELESEESESEESESEEFEESEESESKDSESEESELHEDSNYGATASKSKVPVTASVLFALRIGSVDTSSYHKTEARIRGNTNNFYTNSFFIGTPIKKEKAKEHNLPIPTEWVLTTQSHINKMKEKLKARKVKGLTSGEAIEIFKDITPPTIPRDTLPGWVKEKSKRKEQKKRAKEKSKRSKKN